MTAGPESPPPPSFPEELYLRLRVREGRALTVEEVRRLPVAPPRPEQEAEWRERRCSAAWLVGHLRRRRAGRLLEAGCGNGWLAAYLAVEPAFDVLGIDASASEIALARAAFGDRPRLRFERGELPLAGSAPGGEPPFDAVILAGVLPWLADPVPAIESLLGRVVSGGELLILDSPLWPEGTGKDAAARSRAYFERRGIPEMSELFHHHERAILDRFAPRWYHRPDRWSERVRRKLLRQARPVFPIVGIVPSGER